MSYRLIQLAPGAYDLFLRQHHRQRGQERPAPALHLDRRAARGMVPDKRPSPFRDIEPSFSSLEELCAWLGHPPVTTNNRHTASQGV